MDRVNVISMDVHGMTARAAVAEVARRAEQLAPLSDMSDIVLRVVTGRGRHSVDGVPVIRTRVRWGGRGWGHHACAVSAVSQVPEASKLG